MKHPKELSLTEEVVDGFRASIQSLDMDDAIITRMIEPLDNHRWLQCQC